MRQALEHIQFIDNDSFEQLFDAYYSGLCTYSLRYVSNHDIAEDIVGDIFYTLWHNREHISFNESCKSYLFRSVKNKCLDYIKHNKIKENHQLEIIKLGEESSNFTWDKFVEHELQNFIDNSLNKLPENLREVFMLNKIEGLTASKISEVKGLSQRTIEGQISRSITMLREYLKFLQYIILYLTINV